MSTASSQKSRGPGAEQPPPEQRQQGAGVAGLVTQAIVVLVVVLPLALVLTTFATLSVLSWSPSYERSLSVTLSLTIVATTGLVVWIGRKISRRAPGAGAAVMAVGVFAAVTALLVAIGGLDSGANDPHPTVVNASSNTVVVFTGIEDLREWTTLAPGESAQADRPPLSLDGCYRTMRLEARTPDGQVIDTREGFCNNDTWQITDPGASGS